MKLVALAVIAAVHGVVLDVPDFAHYTLNDPKESKQEGGFFRVDIYKPTGKEGWYDMTLKPPSLLRFNVPCGSAFPPPRTKFWLDGEVLYVVTRGSATISTRNGTKEVIKRGGAFYSAAGLWHGPVENTGEGELTVMVLADFNPHFDNPPATIPTEDAGTDGQRAFNPVPGKYMPYPGHECLTIQVMEGTSLIVAPIAVEMSPGCIIPSHNHPTGAFYFFTHGKLNISGDVDHAVQFSAGDSRWARPGFEYGPEQALDSTVRFMVLGAPAFEPAPNHMDLVARKQETVQVTYENTQYIPEEPTQMPAEEKDTEGGQMPASPDEEKPPNKGTVSEALPSTRQKVRKHLRSTMVEGEESVFLQQPLEDEL